VTPTGRFAVHGQAPPELGQLACLCRRRPTLLCVPSDTVATLALPLRSGDDDGHEPPEPERSCVELTTFPETGRDLVMISLPGVQRLIGEARSTADLRAGSEIAAELAAAPARRCIRDGELVIPSTPDAIGDDTSTPNRIVALAPAGQGPMV